MAQPVAGHHLAGDGIRASEHLCGGIEVRRLDRGTDAGAADNGTVEREGRHAMHVKVEFGAQLPQQRDIAAAFVAEDEIGADTDAVDASEIARQAADEGVA